VAELHSIRRSHTQEEPNKCRCWILQKRKIVPSRREGCQNRRANPIEPDLQNRSLQRSPEQQRNDEGRQSQIRKLEAGKQQIIESSRLQRWLKTRKINPKLYIVRADGLPLLVGEAAIEASERWHPIWAVTCVPWTNWTLRSRVGFFCNCWSNVLVHYRPDVRYDSFVVEESQLSF
jgi:hypothetical protein